VRRRGGAADPGYDPGVTAPPRPRRAARPEPISEVLPALLGDLGLDEAAAGVRVLRVWEQALGPELAPHCRPEGVRGSEVLALVRDSAWMQRLQLEKPRILRRLGEQLGDDSVQSLRLRIGRLDEIAP
jgi:predicted nucleic acid-binding Zn ribbon protein